MSWESQNAAFGPRPTPTRQLAERRFSGQDETKNAIRTSKGFVNQRWGYGQGGRGYTVQTSHGSNSPRSI